MGYLKVNYKYPLSEELKYQSADKQFYGIEAAHSICLIHHRIRIKYGRTGSRL